MPPAARSVHPHLSHEELLKRFRTCEDAEEKLRWQALLLRSEGRTKADVADICKRPQDWVRRWVLRYNERGPDGIVDGRTKNGNDPYLSQDELLKLSAALEEPTGEGGLWTGPAVARWMENELGHSVHKATGHRYLQRANMSLQVPRPSQEKADPVAQEEFKKKPLKRR
jgi:transposase